MTKIFSRFLGAAAVSVVAAGALAGPAWAASSAPAPAPAAGVSPFGPGGPLGPGGAAPADPDAAFGAMLQTAGFAGQEIYGALGGAQRIAQQSAESSKIAQSGFDKAFDLARYMVGR